MAGRLQMCVVHEAQLLSDCRAEVLKIARRQAVLSPEHPLASQESVSLAELAPYQAILEDEIADPEHQHRHVSFQPELVVRDSTRATD